jgi:hypothetical protein
MKFLRCMFIGLSIFGMIILLSNVSFAKGKYYAGEECKENKMAKIELMKKSAAALQQSNPALAKGLSDWAADEEKKMQEWKEHKAKHEAKIKLLTDSAAALEKTNPDLAKDLKEMAKKKQNPRKHKMMKEKNGKEGPREMERPEMEKPEEE